MLCVCHTTSIQKLFCLLVFIRLGHHNARLLGPKMGNSIKCLSQGHSKSLTVLGVKQTKVLQPFDY